MRPTVFYSLATARFIAALAIRTLQRRRHHRTPEAVLAEYDADRDRYRQQFLASDWSLDEFVMGDVGEELADTYLFASVLDGTLQRGAEAHRMVRQHRLDRVLAAIDHYQPSSVLELGCGTGRNLLYIKHHRPDIEIIGQDLSPASVATATAAAERYGLPGTFTTADMTADTPLPKADLVISIHALEQIPTPVAVVERMIEAASKAVVAWEPLPDLLRGLPRLAAEVRIRHLDRLRAHSFDWFEPHMSLLDAGTALNRTTEVHFTP